MLTRILFCAGFLFLFACDNTWDALVDKTNEEGISPSVINNPQTLNGDAESSKMPVLTFEKDTYDFGKIEQGEKVEYSFKFKNTGEADLVISNALPSCGCTVPSYPKQALRPGESGVIRVVFDSKNKSGIQHKKVTITSNTIPNSKDLFFTGNVIEPEEEDFFKEY